ncbi:AlbA family DNA-binding domain-containing protein [Nocardia thailandica]
MTHPGPLWKPLTEAELQQAIDEGALEETHYLDLKETLEPGRSANKKIAVDIAAFALDGGTIVIGVDEREDGEPPILAPTKLDGLAERIELIARTLVHEPVQISSTLIAAENGPTGHGYLVVHVPQSPNAPHMANERFYGRGDKTNRILPQQEVLRLHERRLRDRTNIIAETHRAIEALGERQGHPSILAILAEPVGATDDMLVSLVASNDWREKVLDLLKSARRPDHGNYPPNLAGAQGFGRRAGGVTINCGMPDERRWEGKGRAAEITFRENGSLLLASEGAVIPYQLPAEPPRKPIPVVVEPVVVGHLDLFARLVAAVAEKYEFTGSWRLGLVLTHTSYARSFTLEQGFRAGNPVYDAPTYERAYSATLAELTSSPRAVVHALVSSLLWSIGSYPRWETVFTEPNSSLFS